MVISFFWGFQNGVKHLWRSKWFWEVGWWNEKVEGKWKYIVIYFLDTKYKTKLNSNFANRNMKLEPLHFTSVPVMSLYFPPTWPHLTLNDQSRCFISSNFSDWVTIGWLVKFRERIFKSFLHINMRYIKTSISLNITVQTETYLYCFR